MSDSIQSDFQRIRGRLSAYYKRHEIDFWLRSPHPQLEGQRACDLILAGRAPEVDAILDRLDAGAYT
jgi:uncharacterized protein (DUF2384 family)